MLRWARLVEGSRSDSSERMILTPALPLVPFRLELVPIEEFLLHLLVPFTEAKPAPSEEMSKAVPCRDTKYEFDKFL